MMRIRPPDRVKYVSPRLVTHNRQFGASLEPSQEAPKITFKNTACEISHLEDIWRPHWHTCVCIGYANIC